MARVYYPEARVAIRAYFEDFGPQPADKAQPTSFWAVPRSFSIQRTPRHQPDSWSVEFDYESFPIDPDLVRTAAVEIWLWDKLTMTNRVESVGQSPSQLGVLRDALRGDRHYRPHIAGLVKECDADLGEGGRTVRMEGEDYTSLFSRHSWHKELRKPAKGTKAPKATSGKTASHRPVDFSKPLATIIRDMVAEVDPLSALSVVTNISDALVKADVEQRPLKGLLHTAAKGYNVADEDDSYWDVMSKVVKLAGLSVFTDGNLVVITDPETFHADRDAPTWHMRYGGTGANVESLGLRRELSKNVVPQIEVRCYDPKSHTFIVERFPEKPQEVVDGLGWKRDERVQMVVEGVTDKKVLRRLAQDRFQRLSRGEREITWTTHDMADLEGQDLLRIHAGDSCQLDFDPVGLDLRTLDAGQRVAALSDRGYPSATAQLIAESYERLQTFSIPAFYIREAKLDWGSDDGLNIEVAMIDYATPGGIRRG